MPALANIIGPVLKPADVCQYYKGVSLFCLAHVLILLYYITVKQTSDVI